MSDLLVSLRDGVRIIKFNRPLRKNALTQKMYETIKNILAEDAGNDNVVLTIFSGVGDFYSSGNDFKDVSISSGSFSETIDNRTKIVEDFISSLINYPKLIIAVVNGPAIGIAATSLALCDIVYATEDAYFHTPFITLGICSEGCSSYTFPRILGKSKASEMFFLNKKLTAQEAYERGFVAKVIPKNSVDNLIDSLLMYGKLPLESVKAIKRLMTDSIRPILCECNKQETVALRELFESDTFITTVTQMFAQKSKL